MPDTEVQEVVDQSALEPVDPNADLRAELEAARQKLADVKAESQKSAKDKEDEATRIALQRELESVQREIAYEEQAAELLARASGVETTVGEAPATEVPVKETPAVQQAAPARPASLTPAPTTTTSASAAAPAANQGE